MILLGIMLFQFNQVLTGRNLSVVSFEAIIVAILCFSCFLESMQSSTAKKFDLSSATQPQLIELLRQRAHQDATDAVVKALGGNS